MKTLLNTDTGKGIYPAYSNSWEKLTTGLNMTAELLYNETGISITATGASSYVFLAQGLAAGDYTIYGNASLVNPIGGVDSTIKFAGPAEAFTKEITQYDQPIAVDVTVDATGAIKMYCGNVYDVEAVVSLKNVNIVPRSYPNVVSWEGSELEYNLKGSEQSIILSFSKVVSFAVGNPLLKVWDPSEDLSYKIDVQTTSTDNQLQLSVYDTPAGTLTTTFVATEYISIVFPTPTSISVYKNKSLVLSNDINWELSSLPKLTITNFSTSKSGGEISYLVFDQEANTGYTVGDQLRSPTRRVYSDSSFEDASSLVSDNVPELIETGDNPIQEVTRMSTPTFQDVIIKNVSFLNEITKVEALEALASENEETLSVSTTLLKNVITRNWTSITTDDGDLQRVCYAENLQRFVAVGSGSTNNIQYSDDGVNWTSITTDDGDLMGVCYAENLQRFVAVGPASTNNIQYSDDGVNWTSITNRGGLYGVCYSENLQRFVAVGNASTKHIQYSDDGVNWTSITKAVSLQSVCYAENLQRFVAVGYGSTNNIQYSDDGVNWTSITTDDGNLLGVCYAEALQRFVAVGYGSTNNIQYSDDGVNWTSITTDSGSLREVCYSENLQRFVAVGYGSTNNIQYSDDGVNWTSRTTDHGYLRGVCYAENLQRFVAVGYGSTNNIQYTL